MQNSKCKVQNEMKAYEAVELDIILLDKEDIITSSPGTETTPKEENDGIWDLDIN